MSLEALAKLVKSPWDDSYIKTDFSLTSKTMKLSFLSSITIPRHYIEYIPPFYEVACSIKRLIEDNPPLLFQVENSDMLTRLSLKVEQMQAKTFSYKDTETQEILQSIFSQIHGAANTRLAGSKREKFLSMLIGCLSFSSHQVSGLTAEGIVAFQKMFSDWYEVKVRNSFLINASEKDKPHVILAAFYKYCIKVDSQIRVKPITFQGANRIYREIWDEDFSGGFTPSQGAISFKDFLRFLTYRNKKDFETCVKKFIKFL